MSVEQEWWAGGTRAGPRPSLGCLEGLAGEAAPRAEAELGGEWEGSLKELGCTDVGAHLGRTGGRGAKDAGELPLCQEGLQAVRGQEAHACPPWTCCFTRARARAAALLGASGPAHVPPAPAPAAPPRLPPAPRRPWPRGPRGRSQILQGRRVHDLGTRRVASPGASVAGGGLVRRGGSTRRGRGRCCSRSPRCILISAAEAARPPSISHTKGRPPPPRRRPPRGPDGHTDRAGEGRGAGPGRAPWRGRYGLREAGRGGGRPGGSRSIPRAEKEGRGGAQRPPEAPRGQRPRDRSWPPAQGWRTLERSAQRGKGEQRLSGDKGRWRWQRAGAGCAWELSWPPDLGLGGKRGP